jgi:hypothetical protein
VRPERVRVPVPLAIAVTFCVLGIVIVGVWPRPVLMAALRVAAPLF